MKKSYRDTALVIVFILPLGLLLSGLWFWFRGATALCHFKAFTALPCVSCGMTRSTLALLEGDILRSLALNPLLFPIVLLCLGIWLYNGIWLLGYMPSKYSIYEEPKSDLIVYVKNLVFGFWGRAVLIFLIIAQWFYLIASGR